jgi:hypothetical protein
MVVLGDFLVDVVVAEIACDDVVANAPDHDIEVAVEGGTKS